MLHGRSPHASKRWLGAGLLIGAVLLCGVVFVSVPNPKAINSVHGGAIRCVDNTACVGMGLGRGQKFFRTRRRCRRPSQGHFFVVESIPNLRWKKNHQK